MGAAIELLSKSEAKTKKLPKIHETCTEELVVALCGPLGARVNVASARISRLLKEAYGYDVRELKLSAYIEEYYKDDLPGEKFEKLQFLIEKGHELRNRFGHDFLAKKAIAAISRERIGSKDGFYKPRRVCHIINSVKNKEELLTLKLIYGANFFCIGVSSSVEARLTKLKDDMPGGDVDSLINSDTGEERGIGQSVREPFPLSDLFIFDEGKNLQNQLLRFFHLVFATAIITPEPWETAMYHAAAAAMNSACMSRQVGAAITDKDGNIVSVGWNEVPRFGGGVCRHDDSNDTRCFAQKNQCVNSFWKTKIITDILGKLISENVIKSENKDKVEELVSQTRVGELIEFSRSIHAEMNAIISGAQSSGGKMINGHLYCTTYPCHNCARHIIVAGIKTVRYIEPYRKSLALELHKDALTESSSENGKVQILLFSGVAPGRYMDLFRINGERKDKVSGKMIIKDAKTACPCQKVSIDSIPSLEELVVNELEEKLKKAE